MITESGEEIDRSKSVHLFRLFLMIQFKITYSFESSLSRVPRYLCSTFGIFLFFKLNI